MSGVRDLVDLAWRTYDRAVNLPSCVKPAAPILFFGDYEKYETSPLRILTVGLNPSLHEFPNKDPFRRFSLLEDEHARKPDHYVVSISRYFHDDPYTKWFDSLEPLLKGACASYYPDKAPSTALHSDICSPVATNPTWRDVPEEQRKELEVDGSKLWRKLVDVLRPQIVVISVAREHLERNGFEPIKNWTVIHRFENKKDGTPRKSPYEVRSHWLKLGGQWCLFVFGQAAQYPFGTLANHLKEETGKIALSTYRMGDFHHD